MRRHEPNGKPFDEQRVLAQKRTAWLFETTRPWIDVLGNQAEHQGNATAGFLKQVVGGATWCDNPPVINGYHPTELYDNRSTNHLLPYKVLAAGHRHAEDTCGRAICRDCVLATLVPIIIGGMTQYAREFCAKAIVPLGQLTE